MFSLKEFFHTPVYIYDRDEPPSEIEDLGHRCHIGLSAYIREIFDRRGQHIGEIIRAKKESDESLFRHAVEGIEFVELMDKADRASNGLRLSIMSDNRDPTYKSEFGQLLKSAYDDPRLSDHNHEHNRRTERFLEAILLNVGELRHKHSVRDWIDSMLLYTYWHDADQLVSLYENKINGTEISVKKGHAISAAIMMLALHKKYGVERKVRNRRSWEICAGAAYMIMRHDEPEKMSSIFTAKELSRTDDGKPIMGDDLVEGFRNDRFDLLSYSPQQLMYILKAEKQKGNYFTNVPDSTYGLHPLFENEYTKELQELLENTDPLLRDFDERNRFSLHNATEVGIRADMMDMIAPPYEAIIRLMLTQYSYKRPFFRGLEFFQASSEKDCISQMTDSIINGLGNIDSSVDSDTRRTLWEFIHAESISKDTPIAKSRYIQNTIRDLSVMGVILLRSLGSEIMKGNTRVFDAMYEQRKIEITKKALRKAGISKGTSFMLLQNLKRKGFMEDSIYPYLEKNLSKEYIEKYNQKLQTLDEEKNRLIHSLFYKSPEGRIDSLYTYSEADRILFLSLCRETLQYMQNTYALTPKQMNKYEKRVLNGDLPSMPYRSYDSLGGNPRTYVKPLKNNGIIYKNKNM